MDSQTTRIRVTSRLPVELALCVVAVAVFSVVLYMVPLSNMETHWWADSAWTLAALLATLRCWKTARRSEGHQRKAWHWFTAGCLFWFLGILIWDYRELILGQDAPFPSLSDLGFLALAPLFMLGLVHLRGGAPATSLTLIQFCKLGILICSLLIAHIIILAGPIDSQDFTLTHLLTALGYPVLYMSAVIFGMIMLWQGMHRQPRPLLLLLAGLAVHAFTNTLYAYTLLVKGYHAGDVLDVFWLIGFALIWLAAGDQLRQGGESSDAHSGRPMGDRALHFDVTLPIGALLFVVLVGFLFRHNLDINTLLYLTPVGVVMVFLFALREYATYRYETRINHQLVANQQHSQLLLETIPYGVQEIDNHGRITYANPAHDTLYGYRKGELLGMQVWELAADLSEQENLQACLRQHIAGASLPQPCVSRDRKKDGALITVQRDWDYKYDAHGQVDGFISILTDITARTEAERVLRIQGEAMDSASSAIAMASPDTRLTYVNQAFLEMWGFHGKDQVIGRAGTEMWQSLEACEMVLDILRQTAKWQGVMEARRADGSVFPAQVSVSLVHDKEGAPLCMLASIVDVTESKRAEEKLRQAAAVFESTLEGVMVTDATGIIVAVNHAFEDITGYSEAEAIGYMPSILQSERHDQDFYRKMWQSLRTDGIWRGEVWNRRKNGELFPVIQSISSICNDQDEVTHYVSLFSDISALKESQEKLNHLAYHDAMTDLPNRLLFEDRLQHAMEHARREGHGVALLFIDLDRFKNINDSLGHPVGDALLLETAARLRAIARREDTVARLGGDEFIIVMEKIREPQDAAVLAQKLIDEFQAPLDIKGHMLHIGLSIGIGIYPRDGEDVATLVRNADAALYRVKEQGRNGMQFYTDDLTTAVTERLRLETALRRALANDEFELYYQPQVELEGGQIIAAEALLRWHHPEGDVPCEKFISLAEETGLILPIGEWVLHEACRQMTIWRAAGLPVRRIAVNVSGLQLQRGNFNDRVGEILARTQLPPHCLEIEFTENYIMHTNEHAIDQLTWLKEQGITLTIDDFGTGYSSLSYLKQLPIGRIKIDRSFVRDIPYDRNDEAITDAILAMAQSLGVEVIAEGVETKQQQDFLLSHGCREGQGFLFSHPLPASEFPRLCDTLS